MGWGYIKGLEIVRVEEVGKFEFVLLVFLVFCVVAGREGDIGGVGG